MPKRNILQLQRSGFFRTDEAPARKSSSHPEIEPRTLRIRCNFHDLSHFALCEKDNRQLRGPSTSASQRGTQQRCSFSLLQFLEQKQVILPTPTCSSLASAC